MDPKPDEKDLGPNPFVFTSETGLFLALIVVISTFSIFALSGLLAMTVMNLMVAFIYNRLIFLVVIALFLATLILTYLLVPFIFLVKPLYQIRSEKLVPMGRVRPDIEADILATARRVGLKGRVKILYNYTDAIESYSIGNWFTGYIVLSRGFLGQMADKPDLFKAIISHEIAHLYNRDVVRAELSISMLRVVSLLLVSNIVAFLIYLSGPLTWWTSTPVAAARTFSFTYLSIACFSLSLFLILAIFLRYLVISVLRSRELYADVRAVQFTGDKKALLKALIMSEAIAYRSDRKTAFGSMPGKISLARYHPTTDVRRSYLKDTMNFFKFRPAVALIIGVVTGVAHTLVMFTVNTAGSIVGIYSAQSSEITVKLLTIVTLFAIYFIAYVVIMLNYAPCVIVRRQDKQSFLTPVVIAALFSIAYNVVVALQASEYYLLKYLTGLVSGSAAAVETYLSYGSVMADLAINTLRLFLLILVVLLLVKWAIGRLQRCYKLSMVQAHPVIVHALIVPLIFALPAYTIYYSATTIDVYRIAISVVSLMVLMAEILVIYGISDRFTRCPACDKKIANRQSPEAKCPACGYDLTLWIASCTGVRTGKVQKETGELTTEGGV